MDITLLTKNWPIDRLKQRMQRHRNGNVCQFALALERGEWCARTQIEKNVNNWIELMRLLQNMQLGAMPCHAEKILQLVVVVQVANYVREECKKLKWIHQRQTRTVRRTVRDVNSDREEHKKLKWINHVAATHANQRMCLHQVALLQGQHVELSEVRILLEKNMHWITQVGPAHVEKHMLHNATIYHANW